MAKVLVAMSGGVDSSLVAVLLHEQGYDVTGVTLHLWDAEEDEFKESQCCSQDMVSGARRVCAQYNLPYYVFNYQQEFRRHVIEYFIKGYVDGMTPNPCLVCNRDIKFRVLLDRAAKLGFDYVASGHYARLYRDDNGVVSLWRGVDTAKDQSYALYMLPQADLQRILFPLGDYTKPQVRAMAHARGLVTADRPESQDICFVPENDYRAFLKHEAPDAFAPGPILDLDGRVLGEHRGLPHYTVGQRRGLGISTPAPVYVTELDTARNAVVVAPAEFAGQAACVVDSVVFQSGHIPAESFACDVQLRIHGTPAPAIITMLDATHARVQLQAEQRTITPGQAAVFYAGDRVIGGGLIMRPDRAAALN